MMMVAFVSEALGNRQIPLGRLPAALCLFGAMAVSSEVASRLGFGSPIPIGVGVFAHRQRETSKRIALG